MIFGTTFNGKQKEKLKFIAISQDDLKLQNPTLTHSKVWHLLNKEVPKIETQKDNDSRLHSLIILINEKDKHKN